MVPFRVVVDANINSEEIKLTVLTSRTRRADKIYNTRTTLKMNPNFNYGYIQRMNLNSKGYGYILRYLCKKII